MSASRLQVLIVEDSPERQAILLGIFGSHDLTAVETVSEATVVLASRRFDLVMLDYDLGECGRGDDIARLLLPSEHAGTTVIIHSMNPDGVRAIKAVLPRALELPIASLDRGNPLYGRLRAALAAGREIDWVSMLSGKS